MKKHTTNSPTQTKNLAKKIAKDFKGGETLGLVGELGSGKTQFVKGLAEFYKIKQAITSPTFVLIKPYEIKRDSSSSRVLGAPQNKIEKLVHVDCYRLDNLDDLQDIGLNEFINDKNNITVIEWADKIKKTLPKNTTWIKFSLGKKQNQRIISINSMLF